MATAETEMRSKCGVAVKSPSSSAIAAGVDLLTMYVVPYNQDNRDACSSAITPLLTRGNDAAAPGLARRRSVARLRSQPRPGLRLGTAAGRARSTRRVA